MIVVVEWRQIAANLREQDLDSGTLFARALHMAAPYTAFGNGTGEVTVWVRTYTGSPAWFAVWTLSLCGLAVTAALWQGTEGATRRIVGRTAGALAAAVVALIMAIATGNDAISESSPQGTVPLAAVPSDGQG